MTSFVGNVFGSLVEEIGGDVRALPGMGNPINRIGNCVDPSDDGDNDAMFQGAGKGGAGGKQGEEKPKMPNQINKGESAKEVLERSCLIRETRARNEKSYREAMQGLDENTEQYRRTRREWQDAAIAEAWDVLMKGDIEKLPTPAVQGGRWFANLPTQFVEVQSLAHNIDFFGNMILTYAVDTRVLFSPGHQFKYFKLLDTTMIGVAKFDTNMRPWILLAGETSVGKSYMIQCQDKACFPGVSHNWTHMTRMALTDGKSDDNRCYMIEEVNGTLTGRMPKGASGGEMSGNSIMKSIMTQKEVEIATATVQDGERITIKQVSSKMGGGIFATNEPLPESDNPLLARYIVIMCEALSSTDSKAIGNRMKRMTSCELAPQMERALLRRRLIKWYCFVVEWMIAMRVLLDVNMDAFIVFERVVREEMTRLGFPVENVKRNKQLAELVRTLVIEKAVCAALFSEPTLANRRDQYTKQPLKFDVNLVKHMRLIEQFLVCEQPEFVFGVSMAPMLFGDPIKDKIINSARLSIFGHQLAGDEQNEAAESVNCSFLKVANPRYDEKVGNTYGEAALVDNYNYIELVPNDTSTRGKANVIGMIRSYMTNGKDSFENIESVLATMVKNTVRCQNYVKNDQGMLVVDPDDPNFYAKKEVRIVANHDSIDPKKQFGQAKRYYIATHLVLTHEGESSAMRKSLKKLQHRYMGAATHVVNWQHCAPRLPPKSKEKSVNDHIFNGYYDTFDLKPVDEVMTWKNEFCMTHYDIEQLDNCVQLDVDDSLVMSPEFARAMQHGSTWVNCEVDYTANQVHMARCGADPDKTQDMTFWRVFMKIVAQARIDNARCFSAKTRKYPDVEIAEVQRMHMESDIGQYLDPETREKLLTPYTDVAMSKQIKRACPSKDMLEMMAQNGCTDKFFRTKICRAGTEDHSETIKRKYGEALAHMLEASNQPPARRNDANLAAGRDPLIDPGLSNSSTSSFGSGNEPMDVGQYDADLMPPPPAPADQRVYRSFEEARHEADSEVSVSDLCRRAKLLDDDDSWVRSKRTIAVACGNEFGGDGGLEGEIGLQFNDDMIEQIRKKRRTEHSEKAVAKDQSSGVEAVAVERPRTFGNKGSLLGMLTQRP